MRPRQSKQRVRSSMLRSLHRVAAGVSSKPCPRCHLRKRGLPPLSGAAAAFLGAKVAAHATCIRIDGSARLGAAAQVARRSVAAVCSLRCRCILLVRCTMAHDTSRANARGAAPTAHSGRASGSPEPTGCALKKTLPNPFFQKQPLSQSAALTPPPQVFPITPAER